MNSDERYYQRQYFRTGLPTISDFRLKIHRAFNARRAARTRPEGKLLLKPSLVKISFKPGPSSLGCLSGFWILVYNENAIF